MIKKEIYLLFAVVLLSLILVSENDQQYSVRYEMVRMEINEPDENFEIVAAAKIIVNCIVVINILSVAGILFADYITTACKEIYLAVIHESFKNIKQFPRGSIDSRTDVRYNGAIAILVRAVNGGIGNGRIQKIDNRYGKFAYR